MVLLLISNIKIENSEKFYPFKTEYIFKNQDIQSSVFTIHKNCDRIKEENIFNLSGRYDNETSFSYWYW